MNEKNIKCEGCEREFVKIGSLRTHKRFCDKWSKIRHLFVKDHLSRDESKKTPSNCSSCGKQFKNAYVMGAHKGHCLNPDRVHFNGIRGKRKINVIDVFCENSSRSTQCAKNALLKLEYVIFECSMCGVKDWNDKEITLELDHINGNNRDHRLNNIRLLCPNCHSQTTNWRGRNKNTGKLKVQDSEIENLLDDHNNRQILQKVGLAASGVNYERCNNLRNKVANNKNLITDDIV